MNSDFVQIGALISSGSHVDDANRLINLLLEHGITSSVHGSRIHVIEVPSQSEVVATAILKESELRARIRFYK